MFWSAEEQCEETLETKGPWAFGALLVALQILGPLAAVAGVMVKPVNGQLKNCAVQCARSAETRLVFLDPRNSIQLVDSVTDPAAARPGNHVNVRELRERKHIKDYPDVWQMWRALSRLPAGTTLAVAYNMRTGDAMYIQANSTAFPRSGGPAVLCGEVIQLDRVGWFRADTVAACGTQAKEPLR